jgi:hypothetical protein
LRRASGQGARAGKVFETLVDGQYANRVMVVDEIDKGACEHAYDPLGALYNLLENDTAGAFVDEFAMLRDRLHSQVIWVATVQMTTCSISPTVAHAPHEGVVSNEGARRGRGAHHCVCACTAGSRNEPRLGSDVSTHESR